MDTNQRNEKCHILTIQIFKFVGIEIEPEH